MNESRKLLRLVFSDYVLYNQAALTKELFIDIINLLPNDSRIINFGREIHCASIFITVQSDSFLPVQEAMWIPSATVWIENNRPSRIEYPEEYKKSHICSYKEYNGFLKTEEICIVCNKEKS